MKSERPERWEKTSDWIASQDAQLSLYNHVLIGARSLFKFIRSIPRR